MLVNEQKKAFMQLQERLIEAIRELEVLGTPFPELIDLSTEDFHFELKYSKKLKRFLVLIKKD